MAYLHPFGIPPWVNATPFQRVFRLAERFEVALFLPRGAAVPEEIRARVRIVPVGPLPGERWSRRCFALYLGGAVRRLHRSSPFHVLYSSHFMEAATALRSARRLGLPWAADIHDHPGLSRALASEAGSWRVLPHALWEHAQGAFLRRADLVVCGVGPEAVASLRIPPSRLFPVTNGVDLERTRPREDGEAAWEERPGAARLFYVGAVSEARGAFTLLRAAADLAGSGRRLHLCLAGPCDAPTRRRILCAAAAVPGLSVSIPGAVSHERVLSLASGADACVFPFPARPELLHIYPIKVYEYLALGKPVAASDLPGVRTLVRHGENGLLFRPGDGADLARALGRILEDRALRERLETHARPSVEPFDWAGIHERIAARIEGLVQAREIPARAGARTGLAEGRRS